MWGIVLLLILPNSPATSIWLTRDERLMAVARLRKNQVQIIDTSEKLELTRLWLWQTGITNRVFKTHQAKEFLLDIKTCTITSSRLAPWVII